MNFTTRVFLVSLVCVVVLTFSPTPIRGAQGDLDPSFGDQGRVFVPVEQKDGDIITAVAMQADHKILAASLNGRVLRLNTDGSLDAGFGNGGIVYLRGVMPSLAARAIAIQLDGRIVVAGGSDLYFALIRLNTDGSVDTIFDHFGLWSYAHGLTIQTDGKIVAAGWTRLEPDFTFHFAIARYNADGSFDQSFGENGVVITAFDYGEYPDAEISSVTVSLDKIIAVGDAGGSCAVARYNADGSLDSTFGNGGRVAVVGMQIATSSAVQRADGKLVIAGRGGTTPPSVAVARLNADGSFDSTFGEDGVVLTEFDALNSVAQGISIQPDRKIVMSGGSYSASANPSLIANAIVARYNVNGSLDTSFGENGKISEMLGPGSRLNSVVIQRDGRIVVGGGRLDELYIGRHLASGTTIPFDFDGDGKSDLSVYRRQDGIWHMLGSASGYSATRFGLPNDRVTPADYDGDGKTDISVFRNGEWWHIKSSDGTYEVIHFGIAGDMPVPADYSGDGRAEIAVFRAGQWWTLDLSNNQVSVNGFGFPSDIPVTGDYDGDGKADQAVFRWEDGGWHLNRSRLGYTVITFPGVSGSSPGIVPADYDGDGKTDPAFFSPTSTTGESGGFWQILRSSTGFIEVPFGIAYQPIIDVPVPADYDGDGRADIAIYRWGQWWIRRSSGGVSVQTFGMSPSFDFPLPAAYLLGPDPPLTD